VAVAWCCFFESSRRLHIRTFVVGLLDVRFLIVPFCITHWRAHPDPLPEPVALPHWHSQTCVGSVEIAATAPGSPLISVIVVVVRFTVGAV
jgi:hypothetical protein